MLKSRSVKRNAKNARGLGRDRAAEALSPIFLAATYPFPKSRASYFRFARFNTSLLYYLRAWHRLNTMVLVYLIQLNYLILYTKRNQIRVIKEVLLS